MQFSTNLTSAFNISETLESICFKEYFASFPVGLPKCDIKITLPPWAIISSIVAFAASILVESVTLKFSSNGTLKSTLINAFLSLKFKSFKIFIYSNKLILLQFQCFCCIATHQ